MTSQDAQQSKSPPWDQEPAQVKAAFGAWLRQQREVREVDLDEVAQVTKVGRRYLDALEEGRFELLPAPVFAKGFLREYARFVGLDPDEVVNSYLNALRASDPELELPSRRRSERSGSDRSPLWLLAGVVVVAGLAVGAWLWLRHPGAEPADARPVTTASPPQQAPVTVPEQKRESIASLPQVGPLSLTLDFRRRCWVEVEVDGQPAIAEEHLQGESLTVHARDQIRLSLDHPEAVDVMVNGEPYPLPPNADGKVQGAVITLEGLEEAPTPAP